MEGISLDDVLLNQDQGRLLRPEKSEGGTECINLGRPKTRIEYSSSRRFPVVTVQY
jgi:hypothetical protein